MIQLKVADVVISVIYGKSKNCWMTNLEHANQVVIKVWSIIIQQPRLGDMVSYSLKESDISQPYKDSLVVTC